MFLFDLLVVSHLALLFMENLACAFQENMQKLIELQRDLTGIESFVQPNRVSRLKIEHKILSNFKQPR